MDDNDGMSALSNSMSMDNDNKSTGGTSICERAEQAIFPVATTAKIAKNETQKHYNYEDVIEQELDKDAQPKAVENLFSDVSCCCFPTCASNPKLIALRTWTWFLANSDQFMSSIIVAINLIPEAISYGVMAGLGPRAALQSCWIGNMATSLFGGRPGMISGASGLMALILSRLVQTGVVDGEGNAISGITFVPYAIGFAGILQSITSMFGLGRVASSFPAPVVVGMVNAVALLTLALQSRYAKEFMWDDESLQEKASTADAAVEVEWNIALFEYYGKGLEWITPYAHLGTYGAEVALSLIICTFLPRFTTAFPATLISMLLVVAVEFGIVRQLGVETPLIGDYGGAQVSLRKSSSTTMVLQSLLTYPCLLGCKPFGIGLFE
jgi:MFS superfamily sulfate permease-like transporter